MINQRSLNALAGQGQSTSPFFAPQTIPVNSADALQPIRRHNLTLNDGIGQPIAQGSPMASPRVLLPQSSPTMPMTSIPAGGFLPASYQPVNTNSFFAPPPKISTPQPGNWAPSGDIAIPSTINSTSILDSYLNGASMSNASGSSNTGRQSPFDLSQLSQMSNGSTSGMINDHMDKMQLLSQPNSRPASAAAMNQSLPETEGESSPVVGIPKRSNGPRRIEADDDSSQTIPLSPVKGSEAYEMAFISFSNQLPQIDLATARKAFDDSRGDTSKARKLIEASNPLMAMMMGGSSVSTASPTIVARSQVTPTLGYMQPGSSQLQQNGRPAHPYPYSQSLQTTQSPGPQYYANQMSQPMHQSPQMQQRLQGYPGNYAAQARAVPAGMASIAPPVQPDLNKLVASMRQSKYPETMITNKVREEQQKFSQTYAVWQQQYGQMFANAQQQHQQAQQLALQQQHQRMQQAQQQQTRVTVRPVQQVQPPRPQVSQLVAAHRPQGPPQPTSVQKRKRGRDYSDSDSGGNYSGDSDDYDDRPNGERENQALIFFNTCKLNDLPDYTGIFIIYYRSLIFLIYDTACTNEAAEQIIKMRPFINPEDVRQKLKKTKGISNKLFDSLVDVLEAYLEVDRVFNKCQDASQQLSSVMRIWGGQPPAPIRNGDVPDNFMRGESPEIDTGVHLLELDETALEQSTQPWASPETKMAFADYLREQPAAMSDKVQLKNYQQLGLNWLNLLYSKGLSCILADEMGLGKTVQVIAFLAHIKSVKNIVPHLVIVPSSTLDNWLREFDVFAPSLKVYSYYGTQGVRYDLRHDLKAATDIDVIVTTYNMATGTPDDRKFLRKMEFKTCTYDEGHQLKNSESKKYKDLMEIKVPWRLLLTGTPLQNNLIELIVSLFCLYNDL